MSDQRVFRFTKLWPLALILLIMIIPYGLAYWKYELEKQRPAEGNNHGTFIHAPFQFSDLSFTDTKQNKLKKTDFPKHWVVAYLANPTLPDTKADLDLLSRFHLTLGPDRFRVKMLAVTANAPADGKPYPVPVLTADAASWEKLKKLTGDRDGSVLLIDPHGDWVMTYPDLHQPEAVRTDLKRLLSVSQIG